MRSCICRHLTRVVMLCFMEEDCATPRASHRLSPFVHVIFGGTKVAHETDDLAPGKKLMVEWNNGDGTLPHYPKRSDWSVEVANKRTYDGDRWRL